MALQATRRLEGVDNKQRPTTRSRLAGERDNIAADNMNDTTGFIVKNIAADNMNDTTGFVVDGTTNYIVDDIMFDMHYPEVLDIASSEGFDDAYAVKEVGQVSDPVTFLTFDLHL